MIKKFLKYLKKQEKQENVELDERDTVVFFTGAGISQESGIETYRGKDGLWEKNDWTELSSLSALKKNPEKVKNFYTERQNFITEAEPNRAHYLISELILPENFDKFIITQNVDNLHEKAGSDNIIHLHGKIKDLKCRQCLSVFKNTKLDDVNCCQECGENLIPDVILFGENVSGETFDQCKPIMARAKHLFIIGTTLSVFPATHLLDYIKKDCVIWIIDPNSKNIQINKPNQLKIFNHKATKGLEFATNQLLEEHFKI